MKKTKRILSFYCWFFAAAITFSACNNSERNEVRNNKEHLYNVIEYDFSDSATSANHQVEYTFWSIGDYKDVSAVQNTEISINGEKITGEYFYSWNQALNNYTTQVYRSTDGSTFGMNDEGMPVYCFWKEEQAADQMGEVYTQQQCVALAQDFLNQYVDVSNYQTEVIYEEDRERYKITFTKYVEGIETTDHATVGVFESGKLAYYSSFMFGKIPENSAVHFYYDVAVKSVHQKLDTIYSNIKEEYDEISYGEPSFKYTVLENGKPVLACDVVVKLTEKDGELNVVQSERVLLLVELTN